MELTDYPTIRVAMCDLNGQMRGKRIPASYAPKLNTGAVRIPLSVINVDVTGADIENSPLVFDTGDADGVLVPTERGAVPLPWLEVDQPLVPMQLYEDVGVPFDADPRHALCQVLDRYAAKGWNVVAATELEFTLVDDTGDQLGHVRDPRNGRTVALQDILSLGHLDAFDEFLSDLYAGAEAMGIPAQTATSESGIGQFEITLHHQDALRAADDTWLFKALIRGLARKHGFAATFMAKPFADDAGNGMHLHFSVWDKAGQNMLDESTPKGRARYQAAIAGCISAMRASTLIFAPHANSYARLVPGAHAPTSVCWGYENRTAALRIPRGPAAMRRIEHRVAGGDTNPYLVFAAILGAAMTGLDNALIPPPEVTGNAYDQDCPQLAESWTQAIGLFESDPAIAGIFSPRLIDCMVRMKRQEVLMMQNVPVSDHWKTYLDTT